MSINSSRTTRARRYRRRIWRSSKEPPRSPNGPAKIVAIAEAWCGDVYRELPTVARIAEVIGMELRVFLRDENPDIMDEFLSNDGKARAIPVFVFYTADMQYITHFTERSATAHRELAEIKDQVNRAVGPSQGRDVRKPLLKTGGRSCCAR